mgnify:FL=1
MVGKGSGSALTNIVDYLDIRQGRNAQGKAAAIAAVVPELTVHRPPLEPFQT